MSDRELIEAAARACGIQFLPAEYETGVETDSGDFWCPLHSDGQAFRLMVDCSLVVDVCDECRDVTVRNNHHAVLAEVTYEAHNGDKHAATRRAIVRAAAAMGVGNE